jgi:hypothetical protein
MSRYFEAISEKVTHASIRGKKRGAIILPLSFFIKKFMEIVTFLTCS